MSLDSVRLVLLRRGPRADEFTEEELDALQERHVAYLDDMRRRGHMAAAGPFSDQPDETLRGICLYVTDLEETRRLAEGDPSVRAGRLSVDVLKWSFLRGDVLLPRRGDRSP
ncbi:MAG: YciI family protein [Actinomycetota bacterium]